MVKNDKVAHFSLGGVSIEGNNNHVINNEIYGTGAFGVHVAGGNRQTLAPANNTVFNNEIYDMGWREKSQQPGVMVDGVGQHIINNNIHHGTHFAIRVRNANDITISGNEIHHLLATTILMVVHSMYFRGYSLIAAASSLKKIISTTFQPLVSIQITIQPV